MIKKVFKQLHLLLSVPFGLIVTLICLSGAILIFERDFGHIGQAEVASNGKKPLQLDSILKSTEAYLAGSNQIVGVTTYPDSEHAYKVMLAKPAMAALWVDQYSGAVIGKYERAEIFKLASSAHRRLFGKSKAEGAFGAKIGKLMIGITTISLMLIIISGLIVWWPKKGNFKNKFIISTDKGFYRFWTPAENFPAWQKAYNGIKSVNTDEEIRIYQGEVDVVAGGFGNQQAYKTYSFDSETGRITGIIPYSEKDKSNHIKGWIYTLHVGSWAGWISKILYLICVLIGALLPISGYYLWIKRLIRKNQD